MISNYAIAVQSVGITGYTTIIDPSNQIIVIHKFYEQERDVAFLKDRLPKFWDLLRSSDRGYAVSGYYDWLEVDGSITEKYAEITPIEAYKGSTLTMWATTYIDEFSQPVQDTQKEIQAAILDSGNIINNRLSTMQNTFIIYFVILVNIVILLALLLSRVITKPITALTQGAEAIGQGNLDYQLKTMSKDELGVLAMTFNRMGAALKNHTEELKTTAAENLSKEKTIHEYLRLYVQKISQAQEAERKRIARELHDDTVQSLVVVTRHLDNLASGTSKLTAEDIREEVRKILEGVRHFSQELRPSILDDLGLIPAVKWLTSDLTKNHGIPAETEIIGSPRPLPSDTELNLFRMVQEALTNIRKHSQASETRVKLEFLKTSVKVTVQDNGQGFVLPSRPGEFTRKDKLGLAGMRERAQLLGGTIKIESQPGSGTRLTVEIPLVQNES